MPESFLNSQISIEEIPTDFGSLCKDCIDSIICGEGLSSSGSLLDLQQ